MPTPLLELQSEIVAAVNDSSDIMTRIEGIYDRVPKDPWGSAQSYITFGPSDILRGGDDECRPIENVSLQLDVWSRKPGRIHCAEVLELLRKVITSLELTHHPIIARSDPYQQIRPDPDGLTTHGILRLEWVCEANS